MHTLKQSHSTYIPINSPRSVAHVCKCHISCPEVIKLPQSGQTGVNGMPTFHTNEGCYLFLAIGTVYVVCTCGKSKDGGVLVDESPDDVHLVYERPGGIFVLGIT